MTAVRVAIVGVGNCAASLVQGVQYYRDADPARAGPRPDARPVRRLPRARHRVRRRVRRRRQEGRPRPVRGDRRQREQHHQDRRRAAAGRHRAARAHPRRAGQVLPARPSRSPTRSRSTSSRRCARPRADVLVCYLPVGSEDAAKFYAQCAIDAGVAFVNALPVFIAGTPGVGGEVPRGRRADRRRRHQVPGRRHHHAPRAGQAVRGPRRAVLDRTMQLNVGGNMDFMNMLERERLESKKISKTQAVTSQVDHDLGKRQRAHRPVGLRGLAGRPQVGLRAAGGPRVRRRAAEPGVQARGLGLAQLGRRHHRRGAGREDRQGPRHRRPDPVGVVVLHEVPAGAVPRRRRAGPVEAFIRGEVER